jgi:hypothetical protein
MADEAVPPTERPRLIGGANARVTAAKLWDGIIPVLCEAGLIGDQDGK